MRFYLQRITLEDQLSSGFTNNSIENMYQAFQGKLINPSGQHFFSANVSLSKSIFEQVGGFDTKYRHAEDREMGLRIESKVDVDFVFEKKSSCLS